MPSGSRGRWPVVAGRSFPDERKPRVVWGWLLCRRPLLAAFSALRRSLGSTPDASIARARSRFSRATFRLVSGYVPRASRFSLPPNRYFRRHNLPPPGATSIYKPPPSKSFLALLFGFASRIDLSVSGMETPRGQLWALGMVPPLCPRIKRWRAQRLGCAPVWAIVPRSSVRNGPGRDREMLAARVTVRIADDFGQGCRCTG